MVKQIIKTVLLILCIRFQILASQKDDDLQGMCYFFMSCFFASLLIVYLDKINHKN